MWRTWMNDVEQKAKRRLSDISFEKESCHVALVGPSVGSAANGYTTLVLKAVDDIPETIVEKATSVTVTMDFEEFLVKWFNMYYEDAEVLARALGLGKELMPSDMYDYQGSYRKMIDERVSAISIMKDVYASDNVKEAASDLSYEDSLAVLEAQELLEKALSSVKAGGDNVPVNTGIAPCAGTNIPHNKSEEIMEQNMIQKALHEELVTKAVTEAVEVVKAEMAAQAEVLKAAQAELEVFKANEAKAIVKARKEALAGVLASDKVEDMFKATESLAQEAFDVIVKSLAEKTAQLEQSDLFKETGVAGDAEQDPKQKDGTAAILKAKYAKKDAK
jgi:hypothetical protein